MEPIVCTADRLFDGTGTATLLRPVLRIEDGRITAVEDTSPLSGERYDFPGCTILPGLIDTHVHLVFCAADSNEAVIEQVGRETDEQLLTRALANARAALRSGVTTVRDCGGKDRLIDPRPLHVRPGQSTLRALLQRKLLRLDMIAIQHRGRGSNEVTAAAFRTPLPFDHMLRGYVLQSWSGGHSTREGQN